MVQMLGARSRILTASRRSVIQFRSVSLARRPSGGNAEWYWRNCYIFVKYFKRNRDHVAVLMGQEYLLREFVRLNPLLEEVDPLVYLKSNT